MVKKEGRTLVLELLSKKWTMRMLHTLSKKEKVRFNHFISELAGISPKTLSERLKEFERNSIISKKSFAEMPPRVEYTLTEKGKELMSLFEHLDSISTKWE